LKKTKTLKLAARKSNSPFARIEDAVAAVRDGRMIIIVDDADRENEGDLMVAAEKVTPEAINFMARYGRGLICLSLTPERLDELEIPLMVSQNSSRFDTAFCVPIEARDRTSTGISAADRAATVLAAIDPATRPADLLRPGHMFPLRSRTGGVLVRTGADGSVGRHRPDCRTQPVGGDLRSHERRRHDGARA
jgi:3,4-dihydroxy 2-butanone 4-phosphate synthase/GTP cyclohydrolase II